MILSFCLGLCVGTMTEMGGRSVQVRDRKDRKDVLCEDVCMNGAATTAVKQNHLGTEVDFDIDQ